MLLIASLLHVLIGRFDDFRCRGRLWVFWNVVMRCDVYRHIFLLFPNFHAHQFRVRWGLPLPHGVSGHQ